MSEKQLITKLSKVGNPITLLKMFKDVKKFIGDHQNNFLNNGSDDYDEVQNRIIVNFDDYSEICLRSG